MEPTADVAVTQEQIDEVRNRAIEQIDKGGSKYPGMSYEDGIREALDWVSGDSDEAPLSDLVDDDDEPF